MQAENNSDDLRKLLALDDEDLTVISAHMQDAVIRTSDMRYMADTKQFACLTNRFVWEKAKRSWFRRKAERRRSGLFFDRVTRVQTQGVSQNSDDILSLLAITFEADDAPSGTITLAFSGGATIRLSVECIEARMDDQPAAWATSNTPHHSV